MNNFNSLNNGGQPYYFPADIAKEGEEYARLSNFFKTRVGDNGKILTLKWYDQGRVMNVHGFIPFIQGMVGKHYEEPDTKEIVMAPDALYREWQGSTDNGHDGGFMDYVLEDQMFPQEGIFKGHFGLKDNNGNVLTSVNIVFEVLGNDLRVGETSKYYSAELDRLAREYAVKTDQMVADAHNQVETITGTAQQQVDNFVTDIRNNINNSVRPIEDRVDALNNEIKANRAEEGNLKQRLDYNQQLIDTQNVVTRNEHQQDIDTLNGAINKRLSEFKTAPIGISDSKTLKSKYPNGADGIFVTTDTGHKWIYLEGQWKDCGNYQSTAVESELINPIKDEQQKHDEQIAQNTRDISDNREQITKNSSELTRLKSAGKFQDVYITDGNGNRITDKNGYKLTGKKWLIATDTTLSQTNVPADAAAVGQVIKDANSFDPAKYGIPVLYLYSYRIYELQDKTTTLKNMVSYSFPYFNASGMLKKFKVQGRTSAGLPEKNYTLTFDRDYIFLKEFGYQNKYVIKANYTDFSQSKNVVSARVWGKVRHQHDSLSAITNSDGGYLADSQGNHILGITDPQLAVGKNAGAVDGMPIAVMVNDEFWGLYTLNVPKDGYMAKMPAKSGYAIVSVSWSNLGHQVDTGNTSDFGDVELEYCGSSSTAWVQTSFNAMLTALNGNYDDKSAFDSALGDLLDIDSAIDYYCYSVLIDNIDGINSNFLFQTFNGKKWYIAAYDLDETFGTTKDFNAILRANSDNPISDLQRGIKHFGMTFENTAKNSQLFAQLWKYHKDDILKRTQNLIETVMSAEEVSSMFLEFAQDIPLYLYMQDAKRWRNKPYTSVVNINQITNWYSQRVAWAQKVIDKNIQ